MYERAVSHLMYSKLNVLMSCSVNQPVKYCMLQIKPGLCVGKRECPIGSQQDTKKFFFIH